MSVKPGFLCHLKKGQLIDGQDGFVDTFNWMVDFISNLTGENPIEVDTSVSDHPKIKLKVETEDESGSETKKVSSVTGLSYDPGSGKLSATYQEVEVLSAGDESEGTVFTADPLSQENA